VGNVPNPGNFHQNSYIIAKDSQASKCFMLCTPNHGVGHIAEIGGVLVKSRFSRYCLIFIMSGQEIGSFNFRNDFTGLVRLGSNELGVVDRTS
jgi:hypothetical protein